MKAKENNFAYIDSQNLNLGIRDMGWLLDFKRFRVYLKDKYNINHAYIFIGYIPGNEDLYKHLQEYGYVVVFKPVIFNEKIELVKGNIDADLVLQVMIDFHENKFDKAVIISSDGDFYSLVDYLYQKKKLLVVLSPNKSKCSSLLRGSAREKMMYMDNLREKLEYKRKSTA